MVSDKKQIAEILNNYFMESVEYLEVERYMPTVVIDTSETNENRIYDIIEKFQDHPSIKKSTKTLSLKIDSNSKMLLKKRCLKR